MPVAVDTTGSVSTASPTTNRVPTRHEELAHPVPRVRRRRPRRRTRSALDVLVVGAIAYGGAAVLNAHHLHRRAEQLPLDAASRRPLAAASGALDAASGVVGLDRPGRAIDRARGITDPVPTPHGVGAALVALDVARRPAAVIGDRVVAEAGAVTRAAAVAADVARTRAARLARADPGFTDPRWRRMPNEDRVPTTDPTGPDERPPAGTEVAASTVATPPAPPIEQLRTPTTDDPWRIYVGGDSLAQGIGPALAAMGTDSGLMAVAPHGVLSSGLARPDAYDWPSALTEAAAGDDEIVVLVFGANDPQPMSVGSTSLPFGTPEWEAEYARRVGEVLDLLAGKTVVWVGLPVVGRPDLERQLQVLDRIYRAQAAAHTNTSYVDVRALTSTDGVSYQPYLDGGDGQEFLARTNDKVHFTVRGYQLIAQAVAMRLMQLTSP